MVTLDRLQIGLSAERRLVVSDDCTAPHWGSGGLAVLATPCMIALMEGAAVDVVQPLLPEGLQTVGVMINVEHRAATPVGGKVTARAELCGIDGRRLTFRVEARDGVGLIGEGTHQRVIVEVERFMAGAARRGCLGASS